MSLGTQELNDVYISLGRTFHTYHIKAPTEPLSVTHSLGGNSPLLGALEELSAPQHLLKIATSPSSYMHENLRNYTRRPHPPNHQPHTTLDASDRRLPFCTACSPEGLLSSREPGKPAIRGAVDKGPCQFLAAALLTEAARG